MRLKRELVSPPILDLSRVGYKNTLDNDGYEFQVRCTILQEQTQNGVAERINRTPLNLICLILHPKILLYEFWSEAIFTTVCVLN